VSPLDQSTRLTNVIRYLTAASCNVNSSNSVRSLTVVVPCGLKSQPVSIYISFR
jgi:hypothetical protein